MPILRMAVDANKCMNCRACLVACRHRNSVSYPEGRLWVLDTPSAEAPSGSHYQPGQCMQCQNPICVHACPTGATYVGDDGVIYVDGDKCIGCGACIKACPYGARHKDMARGGVADKCDYCSESRLGMGMTPACVSICPTHARVFGDITDPNSEIAQYLSANLENLTYVKAPNVDTQPSMAYVGYTTPTNWPKDTNVPTPMRILSGLSTAVSWIGGLVLVALGAVFVRQLVSPSDKEDAALAKQAETEKEKDQA